MKTWQNCTCQRDMENIYLEEIYLKWLNTMMKCQKNMKISYFFEQSAEFFIWKTAMPKNGAPVNL